MGDGALTGIGHSAALISAFDGANNHSLNLGKDADSFAGINVSLSGAEDMPEVTHQVQHRV